MVDSARYKDWFEMAKKDLEGARILFDHGADNYLVCFHCHQALEKYFKGYILSNSRQLIEGHGLVKLCKTCETYNKDFRNYLKDAALINDYYIETRYPADQPLQVTKNDTKECLDITENIIKFIDSII